MKVIFENKFNLTKEVLNIPFTIGNTPIGFICSVSDSKFTVEIFDKFIGLEIKDKIVNGIYLSKNEQISYNEFIKEV